MFILWRTQKLQGMEFEIQGIRSFIAIAGDMGIQYSSYDRYDH